MNLTKYRNEKLKYFASACGIEMRGKTLTQLVAEYVTLARRSPYSDQYQGNLWECLDQMTRADKSLNAKLNTKQWENVGTNEDPKWQLLPLKAS